MSAHHSLAVMMLLMTLHAQVYTERIFGGHEVVPHSRPYMVLVERHMENGPKLYCGGFLLNEDFVMTAAHCQASTFTVWLGVHDTTKEDSNVQKIKVLQSFPHKQYDRTRLINDVMVLKLSSKAEFNNNMKSIRLAVKGGKYLPKSCNVTGWGQITNGNSGINNRLMEVDIKLINDTRCEHEHAYCSEGDNGPRPGDSGGPLVCEDTVAYGVVSSMMNSTGKLLYRYTKIPDNIDWIVSITENSRN